MNPPIRNLCFTIAPLRLNRTGLLGWISLDHGALRLDGIALRRTRDGRFALSIPERRDSQGRGHPYMRPLNDEARQEIEDAVFRALGVARCA